MADSTLYSQGYPYSGTGDLGDLMVSLVSGPSSRWTANVAPGWYYFGGAERYLCSSPVVSSVSVAQGVSAIAGLESFNPSYGPIQVLSRDSSGTSWIPVA